MERVLLDTNVVISFLHRRSVQQQARVAALFEKACRGSVALLLHQHVLAETVYVLQNVYELPAGDVRDIVKDLCEMPGVERVDALGDRRLFDLWPQRVRDFGDAVLAAVALEQACAVATFDRRLRNALRRLQVSTHQWD